MRALARYLRTLRPLEWAVVLSIPVLTSILYLPFLGNELVFDDLSLLRAPGLAHFATTPFDLSPRTFPYFTLTSIDVITGSIAVNRAVSLALHIACALLMFAFLRRVVQSAVPEPGKEAWDGLRHATTLAAVGALLFALHPVAVYGAGYLVQRTIVFATIFCLLSALWFMRALETRRGRDALIAALFFSAAGFSKEHAITAPFAIAALAFVAGHGSRQSLETVVRYVGFCLPAMALIVLSKLGLVGASYEPDIADALTDLEALPAVAEGTSRWLFSAINQTGLFFAYLYYWVIPDVSALSADMRIDFAKTWSVWWSALKIAAFLAAPLLGIHLVKRRGYAGLFGFGLIYAWVLFVVELSAVRLQEPFVLYRSYLWAPGIMIMIAAALAWRLSAAGLAVLAALASPLVIVLAQDRLASLADQMALWDDAAIKLTSPATPGADRIYYNRGVEYLKRGRRDLAFEDMNRAVRANPKAVRGYVGRGSVYLFSGDYERALSDLDRAVTIRASLGVAHVNRGVALEKLGRLDEAREAYRTGAKLGEVGANVRLGRMDSTSISIQINHSPDSSIQTRTATSFSAE